MKTFKEHMRKFKTFTENLNEKKEDEVNLLKDLQEISVNEETFSLDDIESAWNSVVDEDSLTDGTYSSIEEHLDFDVDTIDDSGSCEVNVFFTGHIELSEFDSDSLVEDIIDNLHSDDEDYSQKRWTVKQVKEALEGIQWEDSISIEQSEVEAEITGVTYDRGKAEIEYGLKADSYFTTVDVEKLWDTFVDELTYE